MFSCAAKSLAGGCSTGGSCSCKYATGEGCLSTGGVAGDGLGFGGSGGVSRAGSTYGGAPGGCPAKPLHVLAGGCSWKYSAGRECSRLPWTGCGLALGVVWRDRVPAFIV